MRTFLFFLLLIPTAVFAQEFRFVLEADSIPLTIDGWQPYSPWSGGSSFTVPTFCDVNSDGNLDLFVGNYEGSLSFYQNDGNITSPKFDFVTRTFQAVQGVAYSVPRFIDIDADGDSDLFCDFGNELMHFYRNQGTPNLPQFVLEEDTLRDLNGNTIDGTGFSFCDIDADGVPEFFVQQWYNGHIYYYENVGSPTQLAFSLVSNNFAGISTGDWCHPTFVDIDADGDYDLFIGNAAGNIYFYRNDGTPQQYNFTYVTNSFSGINTGSYASPEFADLDDDGDFDLLVGREYTSNSRLGDLYFYENAGTVFSPIFIYRTKNYLSLDLGYINMPQVVDINGDRAVDLIIGEGTYLTFIQNVGDSVNPSFQYIEPNFQGIYEWGIWPAFADLDNDGDYDLVCGESSIPNPPQLSLYINRGTAQIPLFVIENSAYISNPTFEANINPGFADIDGDGDYDLFISSSNGNFYFYRNDGTPQSPAFVLITNQWQGIHFGYPSDNWRGFSFSDLDGDGDLDLLIVNADNSNLAFYRNVGTPQAPSLQHETEVFLLESRYAWYPSPCPIDIDHDGDLDLFCGDLNGGLTFFRNVTGDSTAVLQPTKMRPRPSRVTLTIGPNPSNPITAISYQLSAVSFVNLSVYDISGRRVAQLVNGRQNPGEYSVSWNAMGNASGVYLVRLVTSGSEAVVKKVVLLK